MNNCTMLNVHSKEFRFFKKKLYIINSQCKLFLGQLRTISILLRHNRYFLIKVYHYQIYLVMNRYIQI